MRNSYYLFIVLLFVNIGTNDPIVPLLLLMSKSVIDVFSANKSIIFNMINLSPFLLFDGNCAEAMAFYQSCLGGELTLTRVCDTPM